MQVRSSALLVRASGRLLVDSTKELSMVLAEQKLGIVLLLCFNLLVTTVKAGYGHGGHYKGRLPSCRKSPNGHCKVFKYIPLDSVIESTKFIHSKICL